MRREKQPTTQAPPWKPIHPNQAPRIALCRRAWERRAVQGDDDWTPAGHVFTNYSWNECPEGVPWAALKVAWRMDEANPALRCVLCDGPLAVQSFAHGLTAGAIIRDCLSCRVSYRDGVGHSGVSDWLRRLPPEVRPNRMAMTFSIGGGVRRDDPEPDLVVREWSRFVAGEWSEAVPRTRGTYLTAAAVGPFTTRTIEHDAVTKPRRGKQRPDEGWWWTERLPDGAETLPFGPDDSWTTNPRRTPDAE